MFYLPLVIYNDGFDSGLVVFHCSHFIAEALVDKALDVSGVAGEHPTEKRKVQVRSSRWLDLQMFVPGCCGTSF